MSIRKALRLFALLIRRGYFSRFFFKPLIIIVGNMPSCAKPIEDEATDCTVFRRVGIGTIVLKDTKQLL